MTGINLVIRKHGDIGGTSYAILYALIFGEHIAQIIDDTTKVIETFSNTDKEITFKEITDYLQSLGEIKEVNENRPDEELINILKKM